MREESHLDDMRSAIRGDFERLAERRGGQELMREPEEDLEQSPPESESSATAQVEFADETAPVTADIEPEIALENGAAEAPAPPEDEGPEEPPRKSFLDRLLGR